jgi:hypothetical protein
MSMAGGLAGRHTVAVARHDCNMTDSHGSPADPEAKTKAIELLLEEYRTLRAEVVARLTVRAQVAVVVGASATVLAYAGGLSWRKPYVYIVFGALLFVVTWWRDMNRGRYSVANHIRELEGRINDLASAAYGAQPLLTWETINYEGRLRRGRAKRWRAKLTGSDHQRPPASYEHLRRADSTVSNPDS